MRKPDNYDNTAAASVNNPYKLPVGAYKIIILDAAVREEFGSEKLVLRFDIADGNYKDFYANKFKRQKEADSQTQPKWKGIFKQNTSGKSTFYFKGLIKVIEDSNPGFHFNFDESTLKGKKLGMVFAEKSFTNKQTNKEIFYVAADTPISIADLEAGNFEMPNTNDKKSTNSAMPADMFDSNVDDADIPF